MNQDDYQKKIDEHRQSIDTDISGSRRSRRSNYAKKTKKKSKNLLIPSLFFIFILIPVCMFIYVKFFYTVNNEKEVANQGIIQVETNPISNNEEKEEETEVEEPITETTPETEVKDESTEQQTEEVNLEPEKEVKEEPKEVNPSKTHIVQANETLYRIAINYYKDPNAVEKIKEANGLTSNNISAGQKLILP